MTGPCTGWPWRNYAGSATVWPPWRSPSPCPTLVQVDILSSGDTVNELLLLLNGQVEFLTPNPSYMSACVQVSGLFLIRLEGRAAALPVLRLPMSCQYSHRDVMSGAAVLMLL